MHLCPIDPEQVDYERRTAQSQQAACETVAPPGIEIVYAEQAIPSISQQHPRQGRGGIYLRILLQVGYRRFAVPDTGQTFERYLLYLLPPAPQVEVMPLKPLVDATDQLTRFMEQHHPDFQGQFSDSGYGFFKRSLPAQLGPDPGIHGPHKVNCQSQVIELPQGILAGDPPFFSQDLRLDSTGCLSKLGGAEILQVAKDPIILLFGDINSGAHEFAEHSYFPHSARLALCRHGTGQQQNASCCQ